MNKSITVEEELALRKVEEFLLENMETVFKTSINPEAALRLEEIAQYDQETIASTFADGLVLIKIPMMNHKGDGYLLYTPKTAAKIADLMVMGEGSEDFNPDEHIDAVQEIVDQIFAAFSNTQTDIYQENPGFDVSSAQFGDMSLLSVADESWISVKFTLDLGQEHMFFHLIPLDTLKNYLPQPSEPEITGAGLPDESMPDGLTPGEEVGSLKAVQFDAFGAEPEKDSTSGDIEMLMDLESPIIIELGRTLMFIKDILNLSPGSIVELDKLSGDPVDIYVNEKKFAEGEVVVIDENFGVRITELIQPEDRLKKLR